MAPPPSLNLEWIPVCLPSPHRLPLTHFHFQNSCACIGLTRMTSTRVECGALKENTSQRLSLNSQNPVRGTALRGSGVALLEEVCPEEQALELRASVKSSLLSLFCSKVWR